MVIVDGGTNDNTYEILRNWTDASNYTIYNGPETYWDLHGRFHLAQWGINTRIGMERLETDWAVIIPGDHVLDTTTIKDIRSELLQHQNTVALKFRRKRIRFGSQTDTDYKFYFLNLKKIRDENIDLAWGLDRAINLCPDDPIIFDQETRFTDAVNKVEKRHLSGITLQIKDRLESISCWSYGFYFFDVEQALAHLMDFHLCYNVRYCGRPVRSIRWFMQKEHLDRIVGFVGHDEELKKEHIPEIRKLIEHFYRPEMIGSGIYDLNGKSGKYLEYLKRLLTYLQTLKFMKSGFPSVMKNQKWTSLGDYSKPLDLRALYRKQDSFLPAQIRSQWD
jgi:hypothetical protein